METLLIKRPRLQPGVHLRQKRRLELVSPGLIPTINVYFAPKDLTGVLCTTMAYLLSQEVDEDAALDQYISFLLGMLPQYTSRLTKEIHLAGYNTMLIHIGQHPFARTPEGNNLVEKSRQWLVTKLGQLLFIPYKNISLENYNAFFTSRTEALCSFSGLTAHSIGSPAVVDIVLSLKRRLTGLGGLRSTLLNCLLDPDYRDMTIIDRVVGYVLGILEWVDMVPYTFITTTLVRCASPILFYPDLQFEVENLTRAMNAVCSKTRPAFFKIFADPEESMLVERNKFPLLFAVAAAILATRHPSIKNIVNVTNVNRDLVDALADVHSIFVSGTPDQIQASIVGFIPSYLTHAEVKAMKNRQILELGDTSLAKILTKKPSETGEGGGTA